MTESNKLTSKEVCDIFKVNVNTRKAIEYKYKSKSFSLSTWKTKLKKDGYDL